MSPALKGRQVQVPRAKSKTKAAGVKRPPTKSRITKPKPAAPTKSAVKGKSPKPASPARGTKSGTKSKNTKSPAKSTKVPVKKTAPLSPATKSRLQQKKPQSKTGTKSATKSTKSGAKSAKLTEISQQRKRQTSEYSQRPSPAKQVKNLKKKKAITRKVSSPRSNFRCPGEGFYRDPNDCTQFYRCTDTPRMFKFSCPYGLVFDEALGTCTWPHMTSSPCPTK